MNDAPRTVSQVGSSSSEKIVLRIAAEVLCAGSVAPENSFYDFGGTSLQAMRICVRIQKELTVAIDPVLLLDSDHLGDFARVVAELKDA